MSEIDKAKAKSDADALDNLHEELWGKETMDNFRDAMEEFTNHLDMARKFMDVQPVYYDEARNWFLWDKRKFRWVRCDETGLLNAVSSALNHGDKTVRSKERGEILEALRQVGRLSKPMDVPGTMLQFKDRLVDVATGETGRPSSKLFCRNPMPWKFGGSEETPMMDRIFKEWVVGNGQDETWIQTLYEILSYCLLPSYPIHRYFILYGSGSNGKGCFQRLMEKFVGRENCTATSLESLVSRPFESAELYGKTACILGETNFKRLDNTGMLKALTGDDLMRGEFKGRDKFDFRNYAKLLIASNSLPSTSDRTDGFKRRPLIIDFPNQFPETQDVLASIPDQEYENLARKSVRILSELLKRRSFTNEGTIEERGTRYEERSNPTILFLKERCTKDTKGAVELGEFLEELNSYLEERGHRTLGHKELAHILRDAGYEISKTTRDNVTARWVLGIRLNTANTGNTDSSTRSIHARNDSEQRYLGNLRYSLADKIFNFIPIDGISYVDLLSLVRSDLQRTGSDVQETEFEALVDKLRQEGRIYEDTPGHIRRVA